MKKTVEPNLPPCYECGKECEYTCEACDNHYCDDHKAIYNQFSQIDYDCCQACQEDMKHNCD
jgi:hypothetical protein